MALFTCEFGVCGVFETFFKVQIQYLVYHQVVKKLTCVGSASRTVSCPELRRPSCVSAVCGTRWLPSAYRPLPAWVSVIQSWVPRYLKLAARAQDHSTTLEFHACRYIGDGCSSVSSLWPSWRSCFFCLNTLSALSLTHVYLYRCNYWTYSTCLSLHSALRHCRLTIHRLVKHFDVQVSAFWL